MFTGKRQYKAIVQHLTTENLKQSKLDSFLHAASNEGHEVSNGEREHHGPLDGRVPETAEPRHHAHARSQCEDMWDLLAPYETETGGKVLSTLKMSGMEP